ncbi:MAG: hypothetical protein A3J24_08805 [Deltaproteobacteria bacterium RIFCSPLOWO2_02_FULL_53_8]|nr:MAG: hypothetical protein A3J24_08805 [Deltaproteobacteria bacterium RIFCSPLOWO2_02_FULL_53_8]
MRLELQAELFSRYPNVFRKPGKRRITFEIMDCAEEIVRDDTAPIDERGIECGDGWFAIIDRLSCACENEIELLISRGVDKTLWPRVAQIKEKLCGLRFYVNGQISDQLRSQILQAVDDEGESYRTCELCGAAGRLREGSWLRTYCDNCDAEFVANRRHSAH